MISTIQSYQLNNRVVNVDLTRVPKLSDSSKNILKSLGANLPQEIKTDSYLSGRIRSINEAAQILKEIKDHSTRDKAIAFLKTALVAALVAGIITACVFGGVPALIGSIVPGVLVCGSINALLCDISLSKIENIERRRPGCPEPWYCSALRDPVLALLFTPLAGFVMPLFEAYTRESRAKKVLSELRGSTDATFSYYKDQNNRILRTAYPFFKNESPELLDQLNHKIEPLEKNLADMEPLLQRLAIQKDELRTRIAAYQNARDELNKESQVGAVLKELQECIDETSSDYPFSKNQSAGSLDELDLEIQQLERKHHDMERIFQQSTVQTNELRTHIAAYQQAREELNVVAAFYRQFD